MNDLSTFKDVEKWKISHRRISILYTQNRIPGALRVGSRWIIPKGATIRANARSKRRKYRAVAPGERGAQ